MTQSDTWVPLGMCTATPPLPPCDEVDSVPKSSREGLPGTLPRGRQPPSKRPGPPRPACRSHLRATRDPAHSRPSSSQTLAGWVPSGPGSGRKAPCPATGWPALQVRSIASYSPVSRGSREQAPETPGAAGFTPQ